MNGTVPQDLIPGPQQELRVSSYLQEDIKYQDEKETSRGQIMGRLAADSAGLPDFNHDGKTTSILQSTVGRVKYFYLGVLLHFQDSCMHL